MSMAKIRQMVEREIVQAVIQELLQAGFLLEVNNGEDVLKSTKDSDAIYNAMFQTDEDYLLAYKEGESEWHGWCRFIYGNDGYDVLSDNTVNLKPFLTEATKLSRKYQE